MLQLSEWVFDRFDTLCDNIENVAARYVPALRHDFGMAVALVPVDPKAKVDPAIFTPRGPQ